MGKDDALLLDDFHSRAKEFGLLQPRRIIFKVVKNYKKTGATEERGPLAKNDPLIDPKSGKHCPPHGHQPVDNPARALEGPANEGFAHWIQPWTFQTIK